MRILSLFTMGMLCTSLFAATEEDEMEALKRWVQDKRLVTVKETGGDLSISGEVRVEYQNTNETKNGIDQRAPNGEYLAPSHGYDVEVNLMLDYRTDKLWGAIKLEVDNNMGSQTGTGNKIRLEKAYFGGRLLDGSSYSLDGEVGRRCLGNAFSSKLQFASLFDGALLRFNKEYATLGNFYTSGAVFLISDQTDRYGQAIELGLLDINNSGAQVQYSLTNWRKNPFATEDDSKFNFLVSQVTFARAFYPTYFTKVVKPYVGFLMNTVAKPTVQSANKKAPYGAYTGISLGKVKQKGDWAIDANYQYLQAQAVPQFDVSGIGVGNSAKTSFYDVNNCNDAVGKTNYQGYRLEFLYALADNVTLFSCYQHSNRLDKQIGPEMKFRQFEVELIYAF